MVHKFLSEFVNSRRYTNVCDLHYRVEISVLMIHCAFLVINQLNAQIFEHYVLSIRRTKLYYTASGIITLKQVSGLKLLNKYINCTTMCSYL